MPIEYEPIPRGAIRIPIPDTRQETDSTCGASSLLAICRYYGVGPDREVCIVCDSKMNLDWGADPEDLIRAARIYGLRVEEHQPMTVEQLLDYVDQKKPVMVMLQAWEGLRSYKLRWRFGHWIVAIGYSGDRIYFEDPYIADGRGFLTRAEMDDRWHDYGKNRTRVHNYGLVLWTNRKSKEEGRLKCARRIT